MDAVYRALEAKVDDVIKAKRTVVSIIGTDEVDRFNSVFDMRGASLDNYRRTPVVLHEHGKDPRRGRDPIGKNEWIAHDKGGPITRLKAQTRFLEDDFSQQRYEWYRDGILNGFSIGALPDMARCGPATREEIRANPRLGEGQFSEFGGGPGVFMYRAWELSEYSTTSVPGNPNALTCDRAAKLLGCVDHGLWLPDDVLTICRAMTDSQGGEAGGGAALKPEYVGEDEDDDEGEDKTKRYITESGGKFTVHAESGKKLGTYGSKAAAEHRLKQIEWFKSHPSKRSAPPAPFVDTDGSAWWVDDGTGKRLLAFADATLAEEALRFMQTGKQLDFDFQLQQSLGELRRAGQEISETAKAYIDLYTRGRI